MTTFWATIHRSGVNTIFTLRKPNRFSLESLLNFYSLLEGVMSNRLGSAFDTLCGCSALCFDVDEVDLQLLESELSVKLFRDVAC